MLRVLPVDHIHNIEAFFRQRGHISEPADTPLPWSEGPPGPRSVDPEVIDYSMIRSWLDSCRNHSAPSFCKPSEVDSDWPVRFIDCETRLVVEAASLRSPCPPFLALSYVWGKPVDLQYRQPAHGEPLQDVPLTVEDSIVVTQKLGFRYLWVDKYCIRQDDEGDKLRQVPLMAEIYGLAQITIIAAAGSNPSYGLPGVSRPRKVHQPQARVGKYTLIWAWGSDSVREDIASSVWLTRGWTYQEGLLSTRRLVFTDRQIYFQCNTSGFYETFKMPSDLHDSMRKDLEFPPMHRDLVQDWDIGNRIHEYTRRKLGNEADILNAFQGVFRVFSEPPTLVHNVWGIPISSHYWDGAQPRHSHDRFLANLCWTLETPADRRDKFPSWSWAGWKGVVKLEYTQTLFNLASNDTDITVSFESPDGTRAKWSQLEPILGVLGIIGSQDYHRTLVLDCPSFPLQVEEAHDEGDAHGPASMRSPGTDAKTGLRTTTGPDYWSTDEFKHLTGDWI
ncbi:hypothetical protein CEP54_012036 [Fusarium duplospermum]|uniref:Heterokaryon incompatibility domain-containing protein n=1 Tax=Fusarium duplospermum TaxID=1325734 RepID=A0A428PAT6_9HYPO|nr:hypothetical protein CEP54_012036 [Fusarium duplospermum]